jgi:uncharacterized protein YbcI
MEQSGRSWRRSSSPPVGLRARGEGQTRRANSLTSVTPVWLRFGHCSPATTATTAVTPPDVRSAARAHGDVLTAISDGLVALLKEFYGRGPTQAKSYYQDDLVVCVLRGGFSRVEQTLLEGGRGAVVIQQRLEFQELMRERFESVIADATGRQVIGFMSGNQQDPDMMCEVFILAPTDLVGGDELDALRQPPSS